MAPRLPSRRMCLHAAYAVGMAQAAEPDTGRGAGPERPPTMRTAGHPWRVAGGCGPAEL